MEVIRQFTGSPYKRSNHSFYLSVMQLTVNTKANELMSMEWPAFYTEPRIL